MSYNLIIKGTFFVKFFVKTEDKNRADTLLSEEKSCEVLFVLQVRAVIL